MVSHGMTHHLRYISNQIHENVVNKNFNRLSSGALDTTAILALPQRKASERQAAQMNAYSYLTIGEVIICAL